MADTKPTLDHLRACIGQDVQFEGQQCQIIELLEDGPTLVLSCLTASLTIQPDQHGEAHRRVPRTLTLSVWDSSGDKLSPDFLNLGLVDPDR